MGRFKHEAAACDPDRQVVYLTEAERDGCFYRFRPGDWGDLTPADQRANNEALAEGSRILSAYVVGDRKLWVITEADRSATTILLPEEY